MRKKEKTRQHSVRMNDTDYDLMKEDAKTVGVDYVGTYLMQLWRTFREEMNQKFTSKD